MEGISITCRPVRPVLASAKAAGGAKNTALAVVALVATLKLDPLHKNVIKEPKKENW